MRKIRVFNPYEIGFMVRPKSSGPAIGISQNPYLTIRLKDKEDLIFRSSLAELIDNLPLVEILSGRCRGFEFALPYSIDKKKHSNELRLYGLA